MSKLSKPFVALFFGVLWSIKSYSIFYHESVSSPEVFSYYNSLKLNVLRTDHFESSQLSSTYMGLSWEHFSSHFKFQGRAFFPENSNYDFAFSVPEIYYKWDGVSWAFQVGRKKIKWTKLENYKAAGLWNNAWDFNKGAPQQEGLFGFFLSKQWGGSRLKSFASPVSVPKWVSHQDFQDNGEVVGVTPWFQPPPATVKFSGRTFPVEYELEDIDITDFLLKPQAGLSYSYTGKQFFLGGAYLYTHSKDMDMAVDFSLDVGDAGEPVEVVLNPNRAAHHQISIDGEHQWGKNIKSIWSYNHIWRESLPGGQGRLSHVGLSSGAIWSLALEGQFFNKALAATLFYTQDERQNLAVGELDEILRDSLSVKRRFRKGTGLDLKWKHHGHKIRSLSFYDAAQKGFLGQFEYSYAFGAWVLRAGLQQVHAIDQRAIGFYKSYRSNDFFYGGMSVEL